MEMGMILFLPETFRIISSFVMSAKSNSCVIKSSDRIVETDTILQPCNGLTVETKNLLLQASSTLVGMYKEADQTACSKMWLLVDYSHYSYSV